MSMTNDDRDKIIEAAGYLAGQNDRFRVNLAKAIIDEGNNPAIIEELITKINRNRMAISRLDPENAEQYTLEMKGNTNA